MRLSGGHDDTPFTCSGKGSGEFRLRRSGPGRPTHLVVQASDPDLALGVLLSHSALASAPAWIPATAVTAGASTVVVAPGNVTRVRIETGRAQRWSAEVPNTEDLPALETDGASDVGAGLFRHSLGPVHAAVSCRQPLRLMFFQLCDCEADCENERHRAPTQIGTLEPTTCGSIKLPETSGILAVHTASDWSILPTHDAAGDLSALVRAEVARLLPGLVAEQLAALGVTGTSAARAAAAYQQRARPDDVPSWYQDALEAADDFENQLTTTVADGVAGAGAGADDRRYRWIATKALERATRLLGEADQKDQSKAVFAALGRGREALARLDALRNGRPVPMEFLTRAELAGPPKPERTVHTAERFVWKGQGMADFVVDRPFPHRTLLLEVKVGGRGSIGVVMMERTDTVVAERDSGAYSANEISFIRVTPETTHIKIYFGKAPWQLREVDLAAYPLLGHSTRGEGPRVFRHRLGGVNATIQCTDGIMILFHEICDCTKTCTKPGHRSHKFVTSFHGEARDHCRLPNEEGLLVIKGSRCCHSTSLRRHGRGADSLRWASARRATVHVTRRWTCSRPTTPYRLRLPSLPPQRAGAPPPLLPPPGSGTHRVACPVRRTGLPGT